MTSLRDGFLALFADDIVSMRDHDTLDCRQCKVLFCANRHQYRYSQLRGSKHEHKPFCYEHDDGAGVE